MQTLLTLRDSDIFGTDDLDPSGFSTRLAARAIVVNETGRVALLKVGKYRYHKLPGGGVEGDEDVHQALMRELLEEVGCQAEVIGETGEIIEYRSKWQEKQTSHCFIAKQIGPAKPPQFTNKELVEGFEVVWADDLDAAIAILKVDMPANYVGKFIQRRDIAFLQAAKKVGL